MGHRMVSFDMTTVRHDCNLQAYGEAGDAVRAAAAVGRAAYQHAREAAAGDAAAKRAMFADVSRPSPEPLYLSITPPRSFLVHCSSVFPIGQTPSACTGAWHRLYELVQPSFKAVSADVDVDAPLNAVRQLTCYPRNFILLGQSRAERGSCAFL